jgi:hypothetical protein
VTKVARRGLFGNSNLECLQPGTLSGMICRA